MSAGREGVPAPVTLTPIARIWTDFDGKFGIPRQSGLVRELRGEIVFEPEYRNPDALRGIEGYSHLWLIWLFDANRPQRRWQPTVRPPRLGGNASVGVFATRSPYRPNPIGLSCVRLEGVERRADCGAVLLVSGADLLDGTPILDIKPYLPYADAHPDAAGGFTDGTPRRTLEVSIPEELLARIPKEKRAALRGVLAQDPRPAYQDDPARRYGMTFAGWDVRFTVAGGTLTVCEVVPAPKEETR
ncbi:MAG TPA: tRNA (N6-threonylcarbamoyladenosine(37)-N6)-methyltransferase TrmO [Candidatus Onthomonas avicola]|nr:tRNA (N6-threonylcarbamoyladenosine(37)-N6)-methyltransferase TrmO [Candidatus Onthomonas avicola]